MASREKNQKLIIGLGNNDTKFKSTRHNFGFQAVDKFVEKWNLEYDLLRNIAQISRSKDERALKAKIDNDMILAKPLGYINNSGEKVKRLLDKLSINKKDILIIYDDIDLNLGTIRFKRDSSSGGHKGMRSILEQLNTNSIHRLKLGIGPQGKLPAEKYVLQKFKKAELDTRDEVLDIVQRAIIDYCNQDINSVMNKYNRKEYQKEPKA